MTQNPAGIPPKSNNVEEGIPNASSRNELTNTFFHELREMAEYPIAERLDNESVRFLDVLFAYRILLGRWPEFADALKYHEWAAGRNLFTFVMSFIKSSEFQLRMPELPGLDMVVMTELQNGIRLFFNMRDRQSLRIAAGVHEPDIQVAMRRVLRPGTNCIDIGAHVGLYSFLMASVVSEAGGIVWAFEPFPPTYNLLLKNIRENNMEKAIIAHKVACSYQSGYGKIFAPFADDWGANFVPRTPEARAAANEISLDVQLERVDDVIPDNTRIGLIKMDIEGAEPSALRGMDRIVIHDRPIIFTEFNPFCLKNMNESEPATYLEQLRNYRYRLYTIEGFLQHANHEYKYFDATPTTNLICVPDEVPMPVGIPDQPSR